MKKILNILLGVILLITVILTVYAMVAGGSNEAINLNLIWSYILIAVGIATALFTAVWGMVNSSKGIKGTLLSTLLIIVIVAAAYLIARGTWDAKTMVNIEQLDPEPFLDLLGKMGLTTQIEDRTPRPQPIG